MLNSDFVIRFPIGNLVRKIIFKGCGSEIFKSSFNLLLIASYVKYALVIKNFINQSGIKYIVLFRNTFIKIVIKNSKSIFLKIAKIRKKF